MSTRSLCETSIRRQQWRSTPRSSRTFSGSSGSSASRVRALNSSQCSPTTLPHVKQRTGTIMVRSPVGLLVAGPCTGAAPLLGLGATDVVDQQRPVELHVGVAEFGVAAVLDDAAGDRGPGRVGLADHAAALDVDLDVDVVADAVHDAEGFEDLQARRLRFEQFDGLRVDANATLALANGRASDGGLLLAAGVRYHVTLAPSCSLTSPRWTKRMFESRSRDVSGSRSASWSLGLPT